MASDPCRRRDVGNRTSNASIRVMVVVMPAPLPRVEALDTGCAGTLRSGPDAGQVARLPKSAEGDAAMLRGISPCLSPELLKVLAEMGHGDEIVLADAHFPGHSVNARTLRADGVTIPRLLEGILPLFELDRYDDPIVMMQAVEGDRLDPAVERDYLMAIRAHAPRAPAPVRIDRFALYDRARHAYAVVMTGERRTYGNVLLKKGVTP
jgi:L-fucose mutarotase